MKTLALLVLVAGCDQPAVGEDDESLKRSSPTMCVSRVLPTIDQSQPDAISMARLGQVTQTVIAGKTGLLSSVSMSVFYCGWNDRKAELELAVLDGEGVPLAVARVSTFGLQQSCSALPLGSRSPLFDLSAACLHVQAGQPLTLALSVVGVKPGRCDQDNNRCLTGRVRQFCAEDADCASADLRAAMSYDTYLDGIASVDGVGYAAYDLTFKTMVR